MIPEGALGTCYFSKANCNTRSLSQSDIQGELYIIILFSIDQNSFDKITVGWLCFVFAVEWKHVRSVVTSKRGKTKPRPRDLRDMRDNPVKTLRDMHEY